MYSLGLDGLNVLVKDACFMRECADVCCLMSAVVLLRDCVSNYGSKGGVHCMSRPSLQVYAPYFWG